jgi:hypothetical protein
MACTELHEKEKAFEFLEANAELLQLHFPDEDETIKSFVDPWENPMPVLALPPGAFLDKNML